MSDQLEIRQRIFEDRIGKRTVHPERAPIWSDPDSVRGSAGSAFCNSKSSGLIRQGNPCHLSPLGEIYNCKAVHSGELDEDAARRSIGACLECHGTHRTIKLDLPYCLLCVEVNHGGGLV